MDTATQTRVETKASDLLAKEDCVVESMPTTENDKLDMQRQLQLLVARVESLEKNAVLQAGGGCRCVPV